MSLRDVGKKKPAAAATPAVPSAKAKPQQKVVANKKKSNNKKKETTGKRSTLPYEKVAKMWNDGKSVTEISTALGLRNENAKYPDSTAYGMLNRIRGGHVDGLSIKPHRKGGK